MCSLEGRAFSAFSGMDIPGLYAATLYHYCLPTRLAVRVIFWGSGASAGHESSCREGIFWPLYPGNSSFRFCRVLTNGTVWTRTHVCRTLSRRRTRTANALDDAVSEMQVDYEEGVSVHAVSGSCTLRCTKCSKTYRRDPAKWKQEESCIGEAVDKSVLSRDAVNVAQRRPRHMQINRDTSGSGQSIHIRSYSNVCGVQSGLGAPEKHGTQSWPENGSAIFTRN